MAVTTMDLKMLPSLPGFSIQAFKDRNHRSQTWGVVNGQRIEAKEGVSFDRPKFVKAARAPETWRSGTMVNSHTREIFKNAGDGRDHQELPAWDALDRHVLRFYGFFKESVVETNLENYRVRKVTLLYYLEDDTCQIIEPRQDNSGIPQGTLIRRHRFPAAGGGYITPEQLDVGGDLHIYSRTIRLTDCDNFTREYYEQAGREQAGPMDVETDTFTATQHQMRKVEAKAPRTYEKLYREVMLGGGHVNADMQQFLENDRQVCRFYCIMDDMTTPQFERRPFTIFYFIADDTVEIREQYPLNCGRDNFPIFFRKGKMKVGPVTVDGPQSQIRKKSEFVSAADFAVGQSICLMGTNFYIFDADPFTRRYFSEQLGRELAPKSQVLLPERAVPRAQTPPYTGYGSWDDSMSSVLHLIPKPPKKDFKKLYDNDGRILRFTARFVNPKPEDVDRMFVLNFHLFDDTLSIHEPPQRNLGIVTGKFLEKSVHMNQITGKLFQVADFLPGKVVKIYNHEFEILDCDEYTKNMLIDPDAKHCNFDLVGVIAKMRESLRQQFPLVRDIFRRFDKDYDGVITLGEFRKALEKFGFQLQEDEVLAIMKHFDSRQDGQIGYNEFCDALLDEDYTTEMLKVKPSLQTEVDAEYASRALAKKAERQETDAVRTACREIGDVLYKRVGVLQRLMKEFSYLTHLPTVTCQQIQHALFQLGHKFNIEDVQRCVLFINPDADLNVVNYVEFIKSLQCAYHDLSAIR